MTCPTVNGVPLHSWLAACPPGAGVPWTRCSAAGCSHPLRADGAACTGPARHPNGIAQIAYYATWTMTARNLQAINAAGFRLLTGPDQIDRVKPREIPPLSWALDNGAWGCFQRGEPFDVPRFEQALLRWGEGAAWVVAPDIVAGGMASLELSLSWLDRLRARVPLVLLAVQDGMEAADLRAHLRPGVGLFIGGSTAWKWRTLDTWAALRQATGTYLHVGRVNSARAIARCVSVGADSADGTCASRYAIKAPVLRVGAETAPTLPLFGGL